MIIMKQEYLELIKKAKDVLQCNTVTVSVNGKSCQRIIPSRDFYVHQWLWDTAGIAMGQVYIDKEAAFNELLSLTTGQWNNGLIPHIIYNPGETRYYPPADLWQTGRFTRNGVKTSGITDPPLIAIAAAYICERVADEQKKRDFITALLPSLIAYHDHLKRYRDPEDCGLLTIVHPWESGTDDSPRFDSILNRIDVNSIPGDIKASVDLNRKDAMHDNAEERPTRVDYYRYIYLIELFKDLDWDYTKILHETPFAVKSISYNSIWERANVALAALLQAFGNQEQTHRYQQWAEQTQKALKDTWSEEHEQFCDIDVTQGRYERITALTNAIFMPLYAGAVQDHQLDLLLERLSNDHEFFTGYPVPSTAISSRFFDKDRYWRGPTWPITNYFIINGLKRYKTRSQEADQLANYFIQKTIEMIKENGFWEYFDPLDEETESDTKGMGFSSFSWTAAILIQLIYFVSD